MDTYACHAACTQEEWKPSYCDPRCIVKKSDKTTSAHKAEDVGFANASKHRALLCSHPAMHHLSMPTCVVNSASVVARVGAPFDAAAHRNVAGIYSDRH
jgi:hypothetical protein